MRKTGGEGAKYTKNKKNNSLKYEANRIFLYRPPLEAIEKGFIVIKR